MREILQDLPILAPPARVYDAVSQPALLDEWWTLKSSGNATLGAEWELDFGPGYLWRAVVAVAKPAEAFAFKLTHADADWMNSTVEFQLSPREKGGTIVQFAHRGWRDVNEHYRISCHCWAMYLRILRRHLEHGERVPYDQRLDV